MVNPEKSEQILQTHASLVLAVVQTIHNPELKPQLDIVLQQSAQNGWQDLVNVINKILAGNRDQGQWVTQYLLSRYVWYAEQEEAGAG